MKVVFAMKLMVLGVCLFWGA